MVAGRIRMDPVCAVLTIHRVIEIDWFLSGDFDYVISYDFATVSDHDYLVEKIAATMCQEVYDGPTVPSMVPAVDTS